MTTRTKYDERVRKGGVIVGACLALVASGCSPARFFYYPNRNLYADPDRMGLQAEIVQFPSLNGKTLYGLCFPTPEKPRGTIVHFHGNYGNLSNHFPLATFLLHQGYDLLAFDYEGYGASEGRPTPEHLVEDGIAAVRYAQAHLRNPATGVGLFGQSLGASVGIVVTAKCPEVKGAVFEAGFTGYRAMAKVAMKRSLWTLPLSTVVPLLLARKYDPIRYVDQIAPRPTFFIHGEADEVVPVEMSRELYAAAKEPKTLWIIPGARHLGARHTAGEQYEKRVGEFFHQAIK